MRVWMLGKYGLWDLVAFGLTKHVKAKYSDDNPEGLQFFGMQLLSLLESGDLPGYRSAAGKLLSQFSKTSDPNSLNNVAWFCTYAPDAVADLAVPVQMAEKALAGYPLRAQASSPSTPWAPRLSRRADRRGDRAAGRECEGIRGRRRSPGLGLPRDGPPQERERRRGPPLAREAPIPQTGREGRLLDGSCGVPNLPQGSRGAAPGASSRAALDPTSRAAPGRLAAACLCRVRSICKMAIRRRLHWVNKATEGKQSKVAHRVIMRGVSISAAA